MFFTHSQKPKFGPSFANLFRTFSLALFFPLPFFALQDWSKYPKQRISKTTDLQNKASLERSIFEEVVVYQFIPSEQRPFDLPR